MCPAAPSSALPRAMAGIAVERTKLLHAERTLTMRLERILELDSSLLQRVLGIGSQFNAGDHWDARSNHPRSTIILVDLTSDSVQESGSSRMGLVAVSALRSGSIRSQ